ncbi:hypothetical protein ACQEVZ_24660 [Dactylosporangium sp. CA-152071]|uniref:hypothetical protein n=1 Tax=Dactylosporangium sp. CA-152071 TaxID=3239933 RepID=UPI003D8B00D8
MTTRKPQETASAAADPLAAAAAAFANSRDAEKAAIRAMEDAKRSRQAAAEHLKAARNTLAEQIVAEAKAGIRQKTILERLNGVYTRESVRRICREAGIEPAE